MEMGINSVLNGKTGKLVLSEDIFGLSVRQDIIARTVRWQLAKRRQGTHSTKGISDLSGTTKKPYKQKGTGRARQGSLRSPQFRGGATIFGPVVRSHAYSLPKKIRKLALKMALSDKLKESQLFICDFSSFSSFKTKDMLSFLQNVCSRVTSVLVIDGDEVSQFVAKAVANLENVNYLPQIGSNVYDVIRHEVLILTPSAIKLLEERLK